MFTSTITQKGQVTIPKKLRDALHLNMNDKVIFVQRDDTLIIKPVKGIQTLRGSVSVQTDQTPEAVREMMKEEITRKIASE